MSNLSVNKPHAGAGEVKGRIRDGGIRNKTKQDHGRGLKPPPLND